MNRAVAVFTTALTIAMGAAAVDAAPKQSKRAYKPAERRQQEAEAQPAQDAEPAAPASSFEQDLQAAKEKRDKDLEAAAGETTDTRTLEKKKQEIFAQYAAIVASLRDKYEAAHADDPANAPAASKNRPKTKAGRPKQAEAAAEAADGASKARKRNEKGRDPANALAEAQTKLDEENTRHQTKLDQLNAQLEQASDNQGEVRRVQKAIEKENTSYNARKSILERRVQELGGTIAPPATPANEK